MNQDFDMKIVGDNLDVQSGRDKALYSDSDQYQKEKQNGNLKRAEALGKKLAEDFVSNCLKEELSISEAESYQLNLQKILLLSFTVMAGLEQFCPNMTITNTARSVFFDHLSEINKDLFEKSSDTGAFSFYYLSFRRGNDVERRIGQTFAMLCLHDGDPIYQELGEAIYCWFFSNVEKQVKNAEFVED